MMLGASVTRDEQFGIPRFETQVRVALVLELAALAARAGWSRVSFLSLSLNLHRHRFRTEGGASMITSAF